MNKIIKPPRLSLYLLLYILFGLLLYTLLSMRKNEPTSSTNLPSTLYFNEGGEKCFANDSIWQQIKNSQKNVKKIDDIFQFGGATPKSLLSLNNTNYQVIWKPQLPNIETHKDSSFFEVVYFHLDCLLELRRTPPAVSFNLSSTELISSLSSQSKLKYEDRQIDWIEWRENIQVAGVAQYYIQNLRHLNVFVEKFGGYIRKILNFFHLGGLLVGETEFSIREYSQRDMIDYITANWDRVHNRFFTIDPITKDTVLVYLDHNHLRLNLEERPFNLKYCKFWYENIEKLKKLKEIGLENVMRKSLEREELKEIGLMDRFDNPVKCLDKRSDEFLEHVNQCIEKFGFEDVFGFPQDLI